MQIMLVDITITKKDMYSLRVKQTNKHTISINHQLDFLPRPRTITKHCQRFLENDLARKYFDYRYDNEYS